MRVLRRLAEARAACAQAARAGRLGVVPTMGAIHAGHQALVRRARAECDTVVATIFVNPLQFDERADYERYPHSEERDTQRLEQAGCDLALLLARDEMYPPGFATRIEQPALSAVLEGAARPGHFSGVLTVVAKLLSIACAERAYFGRKDFQQTVLVRRLVADLELPTEIVVCDTVREPDGLALSSRNVFLSPSDRATGLSLVAALQAVERAFEAGQRGARALEALLGETLSQRGVPAPDYAAIVAPDDLARRAEAPEGTVRPGDVAVLAARVGPVRLIDNHPLGARLGPFAGSP